MTDARDRTPLLQVRRAAQHRRMPWRNGAGVTYEVAASPDGADADAFDWRISIAEVTAGGPFSTFPGIDRTIVLIDGEWMALTVGGSRHRFGLREPFAFDGGSETLCEVAGPSRDLNVMTRRGHATATVTIATAESAAPGDGTDDSHDVVLVCLTPGVYLTDAGGTEIVLDPLDAAIATGHPAPRLDGDGVLAVIELQLVPT